MSEAPFSHSPSEKVRHHLDNLVKSQALPTDGRLPTCEELSATLRVSAGTVKNVYRALAREGRIQSQVGVGSFWTGRSATRPLQIGITVSSVTDGWWARNVWAGPIFGGVLKRALELGPRVELKTCGPLEPHSLDEQRGRLDSLDGLILHSLHPWPDEVRDSRGRLVPHCRLNAPVDLKSVNFVSPDYFHCSRALGRAWAETGRRRVVMLYGGQIENSSSLQLRLGGLAAGLGPKLGAGVELRTACFDRDRGGSCARALELLLDEGWVPDAICTAGPAPAYEAAAVLRQRGLCIPGQVSIVAGSRGDSDDPHAPVLTSMAHPLEAVGREMLEMVLRRIEARGADEPARVFPVPFLLASTTRPEESELLARHGRAPL